MMYANSASSERRSRARPARISRPRQELVDAAAGEDVKLARDVLAEGRHVAKRDRPILLVDGGAVLITQAAKPAGAVIRVEVVALNARHAAAVIDVAAGDRTRSAGVT